MKLFTETLYDALGQSFRIDKVYFESKTEHQHLMIFHNAALGRVMVRRGRAGVGRGEADGSRAAQAGRRKPTVDCMIRSCSTWRLGPSL